MIKTQRLSTFLQTFQPILNSAFYYSTVKQMYDLHARGDSKGAKKVIIAYYRSFYFYCLFTSTRLLTFGSMCRFKNNTEVVESYLSIDLSMRTLVQLGLSDGNIFIFASPIPLCGLLFHYFIFYHPPNKLMWANFYDLIVRNVEQLEDEEGRAARIAGDSGLVDSDGGSLLLVKDRMRHFLGASRGGAFGVGVGGAATSLGGEAEHQRTRKRSVLIDLNVNSKLEFFPQIGRQTRLKLRTLTELFLLAQLTAYGVIWCECAFYCLKTATFLNLKCLIF